MTSSGRRDLCVLFASVCGSSRLYEKLGDTEAMYAVERCLKRMERATVAYKGRVTKAIGDEIMAFFETPEDALLAACEMQQRVVALPPVSGVKLAIRVGFAYGAVIVENDDVTGETVDLAAQVSAMAKPEQIVATLAAVSVLAAPLRKLTRNLGESGDLLVAEVIWQGTSDLARRTSKAVVVDEPKALLRLRLGSHEQVLESNAPSVALGRESNNDLIITDPRASRHHGRIEARQGRFVVIDQSTNGTFLSIDGEPELMLKGEEAVLRSRGRLSFGHAYGENPEDEFVEFEVVRR